MRWEGGERSALCCLPPLADPSHPPTPNSLHTHTHAPAAVLQHEPHGLGHLFSPGLPLSAVMDHVLQGLVNRKLPALAAHLHKCVHTCSARRVRAVVVAGQRTRTRRREPSPVATLPPCLPSSASQRADFPSCPACTPRSGCSPSSATRSRLRRVRPPVVVAGSGLAEAPCCPQSAVRKVVGSPPRRAHVCSSLTRASYASLLPPPSCSGAHLGLLPVRGLEGRLPRGAGDARVGGGCVVSHGSSGGGGRHPVIVSPLAPACLSHTPLFLHRRRPRPRHVVTTSAASLVSQSSFEGLMMTFKGLGADADADALMERTFKLKCVGPGAMAGVVRLGGGGRRQRRVNASARGPRSHSTSTCFNVTL
jgi:hypothetical protein